MSTFLNDVKFGIRQLIKNPGFTVIAILTLAIGIGANITIFSFVNAYLLRPLPYDDTGRLMDFTGTHPTLGRGAMAYANYLDWRKQNRTFEQMACYQSTRSIVKGADSPERLSGMRVSGNLFPMLGVQAIMGRLFNQADDQAGAERTVILSHGLWQQRFDGTPDVIGKTLVLDGNPYIIIGVLPSSFVFPPFRPRNSVAFWTPIGLLEQHEWFMRRHSYRGIAGIGKLKAGVTLTQARADLNHIAEQLQQAYPDANQGCRVTIERFHSRITGETRPTLWVLMGTVFAVLLIMCVNIANLLLVRSSARTNEFAVRRALGAGRLQLVRQLLGENLVLALFGVAGGIFVALLGLDLLGFFLGDRITLIGNNLLCLDVNMVLFILVIAIGTSLIFGLAPAWHSIGNRSSSLMLDNNRTATAFKGRGRLRDILVVTEITLAVILMVSAGLMLRSFICYLQADPGYNADNTVALDIQLPEEIYRTDQQRLAFYLTLLKHTEDIAGVQHVGLTSNMLGGWATVFYVEGAPIPEPGQAIFAQYSCISPDLFQAMGIQLLRGRCFTEHDTNEASPVVVVCEEFAQKWWPNENPVGKRIQTYNISPDPNTPWSEVVGVVRHIKPHGVDRSSRESIYLSMCQDEDISNHKTLVVRTQDDPLALVPPIRQAISQIDSDVLIYNIRTLQAIRTGRAYMRRMTTTILSVFALCALLLAALGIYGVMAYSVSRRTNEIGIRIALGACVANIVRMVLHQGAKLAFIGIGIGLAGSLALSRLISGFLFGVTAYDPITFVFVAVVLTSAALVACYIPAWRAAKVDPMEALRYE